MLPSRTRRDVGTIATAATAITGTTTTTAAAATSAATTTTTRSDVDGARTWKQQVPRFKRTPLTITTARISNAAAGKHHIVYPLLFAHGDTWRGPGLPFILLFLNIFFPFFFLTRHSTTSTSRPLLGAGPRAAPARHYSAGKNTHPRRRHDTTRHGTPRHGTTRHVTTRPRGVAARARARERPRTDGRKPRTLAPDEGRGRGGDERRSRVCVRVTHY
ncbi:hypothetical protein PUN28_014668 [Cardiocondyla obscurior]|uniref:Uncharacterized protein n=1 Tax=Cardiocondyla obscurior TaxID=286306 RepID=A0AAW2EUS8_9HYME